MKKMMVMVVMSAVVLVFAVSFAQEGPGKGEGPGGQFNRGHMGRGRLLLRMFDANRDGQISEREWVNVLG